MKFEICELNENEKKETLIIDLSKDCIKKIRQTANLQDIVEVDFDALSLGTKTYGKTKDETKLLQKKNCSIVIKMYNRCVKVIKILKHKKFKFDGNLYIKGLKNKRNNNDFMLACMLDTKFNVSPFKRLEKAYSYACDYIDLENSTNKMCDFKDNKCTKHREVGILKSTGCCPSFCKYTKAGACVQKNLSCKIFMCDYLIEKGLYFSPNFIPILKLHFTPIERASSFGMLCRSTKKAIGQLWGIRIFSGTFLLVLCAFMLSIIL